MSFARIGLAASILAIAVAGCSRESAQAPSPAPAPPPAAAESAARDVGWTAFVDAFVKSRMQADPYFAAQSGRQEFAGKTRDWSRATIDADVAALRVQLGRLAQYEGTSLTPAQEFEREYIAWVIESELFWLATAEAPFRNPAWYLERLDPSLYLTRESEPLVIRMEGFLGYARAVPGLAANIRENLQTPLPKPFIERGVAGFGGYVKFFRDEMPRVFAGLTDVKLKADLAAASTLAAESMSALAAWLESQRASGTQSFAFGAPMFLEMLRATERLDLPLEELELIGRKELERNLAALREACAAFAPRAALGNCVAKARANKRRGSPIEGVPAQHAASRQSWRSRSFDEGWAQFSEEEGVEAGQPEPRIRMLSNALLGDVRFLSAICLHSGCMTVSESEAMFRELAFADAGSAREQAQRGTYDPGYLASTLGKLMIRKLRTDWLAANPDATPRQFHDRFLSFGSPPVPLVRKQMLGSAADAL